MNPGGEVELEVQSNSKISQAKSEAGKALGIPEQELRNARILFEGSHLAENATVTDAGLTEAAELKLVPGNVGKG